MRSEVQGRQPALLSAIKARGARPLKPKASIKSCTGGQLVSLAGKHQGECVFVIGNSYSLMEMDLEPISAFTSIGTNRILELMMVDYLLVVDESVIIRGDHPQAERMNALCREVTMILYPDLLNSRVKQYLDQNFTYLVTPKMSAGADPLSMTGNIQIPTSGGNSAYEAAQIAYRMGAKMIAFAGVDMLWPKGKPSHFFGDGSREGCRLHFPEKKIEDFAELKRQFASVGVYMTNVSPWNTPFRKAMGYTSVETLAHEYLEGANG